MDRERNHTHHTKTIGRLFAMFAVAAAACQGGTLPDAPASETRDSAGGGNGIRSHVLIGVQGVP